MHALQNENSVVWLTIQHDVIESILDLELTKCLDPEIVVLESLDILKRNLIKLENLLSRCRDIERANSSKCSFSVMLFTTGHISNIKKVIDYLLEYKDKSQINREQARINYFRRGHEMDNCIAYHGHCKILDRDMYTLHETLEVMDSINFYWLALDSNEMQMAIEDLFNHVAMLYGMHFVIPPILIDTSNKCSECTMERVLSLSQDTEKQSRICNHLVHFGINNVDEYDVVNTMDMPMHLTVDVPVRPHKVHSDERFWSILESGSAFVDESCILEQDKEMLLKAINAVSDITQKKTMLFPEWKDLADCFCLPMTVKDDREYIGYFGISPRNIIQSRSDYLRSSVYRLYDKELEILRLKDKNNYSADEFPVRNIEDLVKISQNVSNGDSDILVLFEEMKNITDTSCYADANNTMIKAKERQLRKKISDIDKVLSETYNQMVQTIYPPVIGSLLLDRMYSFYIANKNQSMFEQTLSLQHISNVDTGMQLENEAGRLRDMLSQLNLEDISRANIGELMKYFILGPLLTKYDAVPLRDGVHLHCTWTALDIKPEVKLQMKIFCSLEDSESFRKAKKFKPIFDTLQFLPLYSECITERFQLYIHNVRFLTCVLYSFNEYSNHKISMHKPSDISFVQSEDLQLSYQLLAGIYILKEKVLLTFIVGGKRHYYTSSNIYKLLYLFTEHCNQPPIS